MEAKSKTINIIKEIRKVSSQVSESRKKFVQTRKAIMEALKDEGKTIPQIATLTQLPLYETTYYLMSLQKFGEVTVEGIDDMDEYFIYKIKK
jgi:DNA-binding transcriptional regulator YbjK